MEKLFNWISIIFGLIGGFFVNLMGGYDTILKALLILIVADYITGLIKGIYMKKLSSEIGFKGILKKFTMLIVVVVSVVMQRLIGNAVAVREIVIMFFICNEALSLLENAAVMIPIPGALKNILLQLRDKTEIDNK